MKNTCGIFLICNDKLLIGHVTNTSNWSIPKGLIDEGETHIEAALRELKEETNIDAEHIKLIDTEAVVVPYKHKKKTLYAFVATTDVEHDAVCHSMVIQEGKDPFPEIDMFEWVSFEDAMFKIHETQIQALLTSLNKIIVF